MFDRAVKCYDLVKSRYPMPLRAFDRTGDEAANPSFRCRCFSESPGLPQSQVGGHFCISCEVMGIRGRKRRNWCGLAAGVPLELVQRVTGHRTVEVVMKHYFRPGREDFRAAILKAMPKMHADGGEQRSVKDQVLAILEGMTARTWCRDKSTIIRLLATW
jgi:hypothetical protein